MTYEELIEENKKLKAEIAEAHAVLRPAGLVNGLGEEIPSSLLDRVKTAVMIIQSEADYADDVAEERNEYIKKYDNLLVNFKNLDRYNDVLYRLYHAARKLRNGSNDSQQLFNAIEEVERYERELVKTRKEESTGN